jgi:8-oxo-dGTP pyrophosphatase MutT (NUDIX family)
VNQSKLSCGVVLGRQTDAGWVTLVLRAYHHWDFPKGIRELGEEPMQAAIREVAEETSITELSFNWGDRYFETGPYSRGKIARYYIAETSQDKVVMGPSPETGEPEHQEWRSSVPEFPLLR